MKFRITPISIESIKTAPHIIQALFVLPPPGSNPSVLNIIAKINPPTYPIIVAIGIIGFLKV